jgi:hypothetical protein
MMAVLLSARPVEFLVSQNGNALGALTGKTSKARR